MLHGSLLILASEKYCIKVRKEVSLSQESICEINAIELVNESVRVITI